MLQTEHVTSLITLTRASCSRTLSMNIISCLVAMTRPPSSVRKFLLPSLASRSFCFNLYKLHLVFTSLFSFPDDEFAQLFVEHLIQSFFHRRGGRYIRHHRRPRARVVGEFSMLLLKVKFQAGSICAYEFATGLIATIMNGWA